MRLVRHIFLYFGFIVFTQLYSNAEEKQNLCPNIIIILADDMGWNDVSFHNSNLFLTPNLDALAYNGVVLNQFHTPSLCTPSRSSLMTGKFPINTGMQHLVILEAEPWGLPLTYKILPQYLNSVGYKSHIVGKWHLGFFEKDYTPTFRGFESFFGYYQGHQDYYTHESHETFGPFTGYDFRDNLEPRKDLEGLYSTDLFDAEAVYLIDNHDTSKPLFLYLSHLAPHAGESWDPLQAPEDVINRFSYIEDENKRKYAAMVTKLDESVGNVMRALSSKNMLENSIIMFMSDNGAPPIGLYANDGSNYPFRGMKQTELEGGTRTPAVLWSPLFKNTQRVSNIMMHMVDVLPTLCTAAGVDAKDFQDIDGISMWDTLVNGSEQSPRVEYAYNIDPAEADSAVGAVRVGDWKYYRGDSNGNTDNYSWLGDKFPNSEYEKYDYDTAQIIHSMTNTAIVDLHVKNGDATWRPLDEAKILQLRNEAKVECEELDLPECDTSKSCLINLREDPCERYDYASSHPQKYDELKQKFEEYRGKAVKPLNKPRDVCANPEYWNGFWSSWYDFDVVLRNVSVRGKPWRLSYLNAFAYRHRHRHLASCSCSVL